MTLPVPEAFIKPVADHPDLFQFAYGFDLQGKALPNGGSQQVVTELEDGDLLIEGWAAVWEGDDRQGENFAPGAFEDGLTRFLGGQAALCYHHQHDKCLGKVLDLREEGKGLYMKARVDGAIQRHPELGVVYDQIKRGTYNGLSTYGFFTRGMGDLSNKIVKTDLTEISITPVPVHPGTSLTVLAGKALTDGPAAEDATSAEFAKLEAALAALRASTDALEAKALPETHDPRAASALHGLLSHIGRLRETAGYAKDAEHKGTASLADEIESKTAEWEATIHRHAAKVGPLPANYSY